MCVCVCVCGGMDGGVPLDECISLPFTGMEGFPSRISEYWKYGRGNYTGILFSIMHDVIIPALC